MTSMEKENTFVSFCDTNSVLKSKELNWIYQYAKDIPGINYVDFAKVILDSEDSYWNYQFALMLDHKRRDYKKKFPINNLLLRDSIEKINKVNFDAFENVILRNKQLCFNLGYAKNILGVDVYRHGKIIIDSVDPFWNYSFALEVPGADVEAHMNILDGYDDLIQEINKKLVRKHKVF